ncbi:MAG: glycosyltransferase [Bacillota bacterium]
MNNWLEQALKYESESNLLLSTQYYTRALQENPEDQDVLYYGGLFLFKMGKYDQALDLFVKCYSSKSLTEELKEELLSQLLAAYYEPNAEGLKKTYETNVKNLLAYEFNYLKSFPSFEDLPFICIPRNDSSYFVFDKATKIFLKVLDLQNESDESSTLAKEECVLAIDIYEKEKLLAIHEKTFKPALNGIKIPIYLVWTDPVTMQVYLQLEDFRPIIEKQRFVFFPDYREESGVASFFKDHQSMIPNKCIGSIVEDEIRSFFKTIKETRDKDVEEKLSQVLKLAESYDDQYYKDLFLNHKGDLRILFITCRFTTFLQYSTRDCMSASVNLGIKSDLLIEKSDIQRIFVGNSYEKILDFKPNIIFMLDHFKWEFGIPDNLMCITWVQDPLPNILSRDSAKKLSDNDLVLVGAPKLKDQMLELGYPEADLFDQIIPVNSLIFDKIELVGTEKARYASDITYVSHVGDPKSSLDALVSEYITRIEDEDIRPKFKDFLYSAYELTRRRIEGSEPIFTVEDYKHVLAEALEGCGFQLYISDDFAYEFGSRVGNRLHRTIPLVWVAECGHSLKIWGREWVNNSQLKKFAMGTAAHGEELAKIYSSARITLGIQPYGTMHQRALEAMACGSLYMSRQLPAEHDYNSIGNYFIEGEDFVSFSSKDDLLDKVHYFLENERERKRIAENGRKKTVQNYTYDKAIQNLLSVLRDVQGD